MSNLAVKRKHLLVVSGLLWTTIGMMLLRFAYLWLADLNISSKLSFTLAGLALGTIIGVLGLSKVAKKNVKRIRRLPEKVSLFAFQAGKNYIMIVLMITMGVYLRTHALIARPYLAVLYTAMGSALMLASIIYYSEYRVNLIKN